MPGAPAMPHTLPNAMLRAPSTPGTCAMPSTRATCAHLEEQVVFEDPLHRLQQVGTQWEHMPHLLLALTEKTCLLLAPHALT